MHGLNTYDYGARQYYAFLPTWDRIDPLCEKYYSISPYQNEETNAAIKLGEIPSDAETSRTDHGGIPFKTESSTSREIMNPTDEQVYLWIITWCNL